MSDNILSDANPFSNPNPYAFATDAALAAVEATRSVGPGQWKGSAAPGNPPPQLTAADNRTVTRRWDRANFARFGMDRMMQNVEGGVDQQGGKLTGLSHSLKDLDSYRRKIADDVLPHPNGGAKASLADAMKNNNDLHRYTMTFPPENYVRGTFGTVQGLVGTGNKTGPIKNKWGQVKYKGLNATFTNPKNGLFEVQAHTPDSFRVKSETHAIYEASRSPSMLSGGMNPRDVANASKYLQGEKYRGMEIPRNVHRLPGWEGAEAPPKTKPDVVNNLRNAANNIAAKKASEKLPKPLMGSVGSAVTNSTPWRAARQVAMAPSHYGNRFGDKVVAGGGKVAASTVGKAVAGTSVAKSMQNAGKSVTNSKLAASAANIGGKAANSGVVKWGGRALGAAGTGLAIYSDVKGGESVKKAVVTNGIGLGASIAAGAAVGTMIPVPVVGTVAGAVVGAAVGLGATKAAKKGWDWAANKLGKKKKMADGGPVYGAGSSIGDMIPAMLSNGEFVVNAASAGRFKPLLESINKGVPGFAPPGMNPAMSSVLEKASSGFGNAANAFVSGQAGDVMKTFGLKDTPAAMKAGSQAAELLKSVGPQFSSVAGSAAKQVIPAKALVASAMAKGGAVDQSMTINLQTPDLDTAFQKSKTLEAQRALTYAGRW